LNLSKLVGVRLGKKMNMRVQVSNQSHGANIYFPCLMVVSGASSQWMTSLEEYAMYIDTKETMGSWISRTRQAFIVRTALYTAAAIHMTTVIIILAGLVVLVHAISS